MFSTFSVLTLACSGEGAAETIQNAIRVGWASFVLTALLLTWLLVSRVLVSGRGFAAIVLGVLLTMHPAWTVSATQGDCGGTKVMLSLLVGAIAIISVGAVAIRSLSERAAELSGVISERPSSGPPTTSDPDNPYQSSSV
jgi:hypothetical protein